MARVPATKGKTRTQTNIVKNEQNPQNLHPASPKIAVRRDLMQINNASSPNDENEQLDHHRASEDSSCTIPKGRSLAHFDFAQNNVALVSFDIETGGEFCWILQLSAEIFRAEIKPTITPKGPSPNKDHCVSSTQEAVTFNEYVKPDEGAIWNEHACSVHGLHENHHKILGAWGIDDVQATFFNGLHLTLEEKRSL